MVFSKNNQTIIYFTRNFIRQHFFRRLWISMVFLTYRVLCLIHSSSLVGQPKTFLAPLLAPEPSGNFFVLWDFFAASWISFKNLEIFPPKLWRLSKIFGGVVVYFKKGPDFDFQTPKLGCSSKTLQAPSQLATKNPLHPESWRNSENPSFLLKKLGSPENESGILT